MARDVPFVSSQACILNDLALIQTECYLLPGVSSLLETLPDRILTAIRYAHMKKDVFHEGRQSKTLSLTELLLAAGAGGVPAGTSPSACSSSLRIETDQIAYLTTPFDVASKLYFPDLCGAR